MNTPTMGTRTPPVSLFVLVAIVATVWLALAIGTYYLQEGWEKRGQFGDMFGAVNALFSGLAFAILIYDVVAARGT